MVVSDNPCSQQLPDREERIISAYRELNMRLTVATSELLATRGCPAIRFAPKLGSGTARFSPIECGFPTFICSAVAYRTRRSCQCGCDYQHVLDGHAPSLMLGARREAVNVPGGLGNPGLATPCNCQ